MPQSSPAGGGTRGFGPFVTLRTATRPDGTVDRWESRWYRKHQAGDATGTTWWAPRSRSWWIGVLFAVGSLLFALGSALPAWRTVSPLDDAVCLFVGSLFFTSAGLLQYREAVDAGPTVPGRRRRLLIVWEPGRIDWTATVVQLAGTLFFNVSTAHATVVDLTATAADREVWRPDVFGSACFLVASGLAWFEVCHGWGTWRPRSTSWQLTLLNLVGSVAFGASAVASYVVPATGDLRNAELSNAGTFVGSVCFLAGALLLLRERTEGRTLAPVG